MLLLLLGCLLDRATYEARLAELTDDDGDGASEVDGDCDDTLAEVAPAAAESCNARDDDCDGLADEAEDLSGAAWYADSDDDGFGGGAAVVTCAPAAGMVQGGGDCDDTDPLRAPGAAERCNGLDDDCDGEADEVAEVETLDWYPDADGDGFGDGVPVASCPDPGGHALADGDCADDDAARNPAATETCNGVDDDCNGAVDDAPAVTWYLDRDEDGFGDDGATYVVCTPPPGYSRDGGDCDDLDGERNPGAWDECEDGVDADCDGLDVPCGIPTGEADVDDVSARFTGTAGEAYVARSVASAGDLDGDGDDELVVARGGWDDFTGKVHLVPGRADLYLGELALDDVGVELRGSTAYGAFGFALGTGADVDGDGTDDLAVTSYGPDRVALFRGSASLLASDHDDGDAWATWRSSEGTGTFGISVALLGDLDGDGFGEVVIGDNSLDDMGAAYLFYGDGVGGEYDADEAVVFVGAEVEAQLGYEVASAGDLDGDGFVDFVVGDNYNGATPGLERGYVFLGAGSRLSAPTDISDADRVYTSDGEHDSAFDAVHRLGDVNGDGRGDLVVANGSSADEGGRAHVVAGATVLPGSGALSDVDLVVLVGGPEEGVADSVGGPGDLDADGFSDLAAVSARGRASGARLLVVPGSAGLSGAVGLADASTVLTGANTEAEGDAVAQECDLNGDAAPDLAVSGWNAGTVLGELWLAYGSR